MASVFIFYQQRDGKIIIGEQGILDIDDKNKLKNYPKYFISKSMEEKYINKIIKTGKLFLKEIESIPIDEVKIDGGLFHWMKNL